MPSSFSSICGEGLLADQPSSTTITLLGACVSIKSNTGIVKILIFLGW